MNVHLSDEACINVNSRQTIRVPLVEVKQFASPDVKKNLSNHSLARVLNHSIARTIQKPASNSAGESHDDILRLMKNHRQKEENHEEIELFGPKIIDNVDDDNGSEIDPEDRSHR